MLNFFQGKIDTVPILVPIFLVVAGVIFIVFIIGMILLLSFALKRRSADPQRGLMMKNFAAEKGWSYSQKTEPSFLPNFVDLEIRESLNPVALENFISANIDGTRLAIFDYVYRRQPVGGSGGTITHRETVCYLESGRLELPFFRVSPEGTIEKFAAGLLERDIDFEHHPVFSEKFYLRSDNETAIRHKFNENALKIFEQRPGITAVGRANALYLYYEGKLLKADQILFLIDSAVKLQRSL